MGISNTRVFLHSLTWANYKTTGLGKCLHLLVMSMPVAFTGIFRNNPTFSGIFWHIQKNLTGINLLLFFTVFAKVMFSHDTAQLPKCFMN